MNNVKEFACFEEMLNTVQANDIVVCTYSSVKYFTQGESYTIIYVESRGINILDNDGNLYNTYCLNGFYSCRFGIEEKEHDQAVVMKTSSKKERVALAKKYREAYDDVCEASKRKIEAEDILASIAQDFEDHGMVVEEKVDEIVISFSPQVEKY